MILGVNTSHDVSFCVVDELGRTRYLLEEERYNRYKHTEYFSLHALDRLVADGELDPLAVTDIAYGFEDDDAAARLAVRCEANVARDFGPEALTRLARSRSAEPPLRSATWGLGRTRSFEDTDAALRALFPRAQARSYNHHRTHAASAFYPSPFEDAAVLVVDGAGRLETATIWTARSGALELLQQTELPHSLGTFYWLVAHVLGLEEGKVMGLSAYGVPRFADALLARVIAPEPDAGFRFLAPILFWGTLDAEGACAELLRAVPVPRRFRPDDALTQIHADFAASAQRVTETILVHLVGRAAALSGCRSVCLAGGVMQNSVALRRVLESGAFDRYWVQPVAHDAGSAWGAALLVAAERGLPHVRDTRDTAFLGRGPTDTEISGALERTGMAGARAAHPESRAAETLLRGGVIGWVRGRAEVGPRALGARSLLALPRFPFNHFRLNRIKSREPWRPLAPVFRLRDLSRFATTPLPSPHMNVCLPISPAARGSMPAAVHVDGTARVQTVEDGDPGGLAALLDALEREGVEPCVLNTSFNDAGEPMVQSPIEALRHLVIGSLDALFVEDWVVEPPAETDGALRDALARNRFVQRYLELLGRGPALVLAPEDPALHDRCDAVVRSLAWLGVATRRVTPAEIGAAASDPPGAVLTLEPGVDLRRLHGAPPTWLASVPWILVSDDLYPCPASHAALSALVDRNDRALERALERRRAVAWMSPSEWRRFHTEAPRAARFAELVETEPRPRDRSGIYHIASLSTFERHRDRFADLTPHVELTVWVFDDRHLRHAS